MTTTALYLHLPFCSRKCDYCAFHSITEWDRRAQRSFARAIERDLCELAPRLRHVRTLYLGGGTPTTLEPAVLAALVRAAKTKAPLEEITVEANPESATAEHLAAMTEAGVSRISVGVQTLEPAAANGLGRRLTSPDELATIRSSWNGALSADLIHAAPGETVSGLLHGIDLLVDLGFDHLSVYGLGVEPGTRLAHRVASGEVVAPVPEDGWRSIVARIGSHGLRRYEVSNFARPGAECRHNLAYWRGDGYLGLGPSAVSTLELDSGVVRLTQPTDHAAYFARRSFFDCDHEVLGASEQRLERLLLGLRTFHGVDLASIGSSLDDRARARLDLAVGREIDGGLLRADGSTIYPTERGLDLLDCVVAGLAAAF